MPRNGPPRAAVRRVPPPRTHWLLLGVVLTAVIFLLAIDVLALGGFRADESTQDRSADAVPLDVRSGGSVIDTHSGSPIVLRPKDKHLALTFDDGPDPVWTPAVLDALDRFHVRATFFVTGAHAARHPDLVRDILARGHELGNHTATHVDLRGVGDVREQLELRSTDLAVAGATGRTMSLVRPPFSATPDAVDDLAWRAIERVGADGRIVVLSDIDSKDWQRQGVDAVVANATPKDDRGAVVLMHDSGGDRAQTVAALDRLIPAMLARGWTLDTVSRAVGITHIGTHASVGERMGGWLLVSAVSASGFVADALAVVLIAASALAAVRMLIVLATTAIHVRRRRDRTPRPVRDPVTVIVPAYNEQAGIGAAVQSILASDHPVRVIVVDDGSTDRTAEIVERLRSPRVSLLRQANAGKPVAINTALAAARTEFVVMVDGDTLLEPSAVRMLVRHFADPSVGAVSGNAKVGNRAGVLGMWQHIEYVIGFNLDRRMYDVLGCMPTVPGAVGAFRRSAVLGQGGVSVDTLAEDTDLTMALERGGWRVVYEQDARAHTEAPATLGQLWKQRYRWCYGTLQAVWKHRRSMLERGAAGRLGRRGLPYLLIFQVLLPLLAPLVDVAAVVGLFTGDWLHLTIFWLVLLVAQAIPGMIAFRLDRESLRPLLLLPLQQFVYRQLMYLVVVQSVVTAIAGARLPWHKLRRRGLVTSAGPPRHAR